MIQKRVSLHKWLLNTTGRDRGLVLCWPNLLLGLKEEKPSQVLQTYSTKSMWKDGSTLLRLFTKKGLFYLSNSSTEEEHVLLKRPEALSLKPLHHFQLEAFTPLLEKIMKHHKKWPLKILNSQKNNTDIELNSLRRLVLTVFSFTELMDTWLKSF